MKIKISKMEIQREKEVQSSTVQNGLKEGGEPPRYPLANAGINEMHAHTIQGQSAVKRDKLLLSERGQTPEGMSCRIPFAGIIR